MWTASTYCVVSFSAYRFQNENPNIQSRGLASGKLQDRVAWCRFCSFLSFLLCARARFFLIWICRTMWSSVCSSIFPTWCVVLDMITHFALELNNKWSATIWMIILVVVFKRFTTVRWLRLARSSVNHSEVGLCWWRWFVCFFFTCVLSFRLYCFSCLFLFTCRFWLFLFVFRS